MNVGFGTPGTIVYSDTAAMLQFAGLIIVIIVVLILVIVVGVPSKTRNTTRGTTPYVPTRSQLVRNTCACKLVKKKDLPLTHPVIQDVSYVR